jgi:hypothetical protein
LIEEWTEFLKIEIRRSNSSKNGQNLNSKIELIEEWEEFRIGWKLSKLGEFRLENNSKIVLIEEWTEFLKIEIRRSN